MAVGSIYCYLFSSVIVNVNKNRQAIMLGDYFS